MPLPALTTSYPNKIFSLSEVTRVASDDSNDNSKSKDTPDILAKKPARTRNNKMVPLSFNTGAPAILSAPQYEVGYAPADFITKRVFSEERTQEYYVSTKGKKEKLISNYNDNL